MSEKLRTHKQKGQKQSTIEVNPRVVLGKEEYQQWKYLRSKNIRITTKQFKNYLSDVKKANAKLSKLEDDANYLGIHSKISESVSYMRGQEDWDDAVQRINRINSKDFVDEITRENLDRLQYNVDKIFGKDVNFRNLKPKTIKRFFEDFPELKTLLYYPEEEEVNKTLELMGKTKKAIKMSLEYLKKEEQKGK